MILSAFKTFVGDVWSRSLRTHAHQPPVRNVTYGEEGFSHVLITGRGGCKAETRENSCGIDGREQTESFVLSQAVGPSNVCGTRQPSLASSLGIPDGYRRRVQSLVGTPLYVEQLRQMQSHFCNEIPLSTDRAVELATLGEGGKSIDQADARIAVEVPFAAEAAPLGEDSEGYNLAGTEGRLRSGSPLFWRAGVAEIVHHNVECGEEGVHIDHEESVPFPSGSVSKPTLVCGHLLLKVLTDNSHQAFKDRRLPEENTLGKRGRGLVQFLQTLNGGRVAVAALSVGLAQACFDEALKRAKERRQFGKAVPEFQVTSARKSGYPTRVRGLTAKYEENVTNHASTSCSWSG